MSCSEYGAGRRVVNAEAGAGLWRRCECLAETPLILSTFPVLEVGDGDPGGVGQEPLQGVVESLGGSENQVKLALLLLKGQGKGLSWGNLVVVGGPLEARVK